jgi:hypothetical protein
VEEVIVVTVAVCAIVVLTAAHVSFSAADNNSTLDSPMRVSSPTSWISLHRMILHSVAYLLSSILKHRISHPRSISSRCHSTEQNGMVWYRTVC